MNKRFLLLLPLATSVLLAMSFSHYELGWISLFSLVPLFLFARLARSYKYSAKAVILFVWLSGVIFFAFTMIWLLYTRPDSWAAIQGTPAIVGSVFTWVGFTVIYSLAFFALGWVLSRWQQLLGHWWAVFIIPSVWIAGEFFRSWFFSVAAWGPDATIGAHWNFGNLGFAASVTSLAPLSKLIGLFGLSFVVVAINVALFWMLRRKVLWPAIGLGVVLALTVLSYQVFRPVDTDQQLRFGVVQLGDPSDNYPDTLAETMKAGREIDVLLLPEYSNFFSTDENWRRQIIQASFAGNTGLIITSAPVRIGDKHHTEIQFAKPDGEILERQYKNFLIPVGEYLPKVIEGLLLLTANKEEVNRYRDFRVHNKGPEPERVYEYEGVGIGELSCSGAISPTLYRDLARQDAQILTNSASLGIFAHTDRYFQQAKQIARFQAVAYAKPFLQASRGGFSYYIDGEGQFINETSEPGADYFTASVSPNSIKTLYGRLGEWMLVVATGILTLGWTKVRRKR